MAQVSAKREQIEQAMNAMVLIASIGIFVTVFSLLSAHSLWNKLSFQNHLITAKTTARNQLLGDVTAAKSLNNSYESFNQATTNLLGANVTGKDNDNAKIILDSLPSTYDYPALTTSLQSLLSNQGVNIDSIGGTDESATISSSPGGGPVAMPFTFSIDGPYSNVQNALNTFEKSIRPFQFQTMDFSGDQSDVTLTVTAQTFFQPASQFTITQEKVQ
ncbi:MAG TPA: hypothetical protein VGF75_04485 [Candidatus Saccharimonadales bacterium]|jgi:hypothetical protein